MVEAGDESLYHEWQRLTTSDHFYYMATKDHSDGAVHAYFSAYGSPYDAFVRFMNIAEDVEQRARTITQRKASTKGEPAVAPAPTVGQEPATR